MGEQGAEVYTTRKNASEQPETGAQALGSGVSPGGLCQRGRGCQRLALATCERCHRLAPSRDTAGAQARTKASGERAQLKRRLEPSWDIRGPGELRWRRKPFGSQLLLVSIFPAW